MPAAPVNLQSSVSTAPTASNHFNSVKATTASPGHQHFRQISDSRILGLKTPYNSSSLSERKPSFVLSTLSNDLAGGSSDGWSLRSFSKLVASSQRERWSFDSEHFGCGRHRIKQQILFFLFSRSPNVWACSKVVPEFSVVAILACGYAYHAECLETMTTEADKYDPVSQYAQSSRS